MNWQKNLKGRINSREPLSKYTTFKIGGPARFFARPKNIEDLKLLLKQAKSDKIPILVIGAGSNILASDKGVKAVVVKLDALCFTQIASRGLSIEAGSGVLLSRLIRFAANKGLGGAEFLAGIPGTVGGAVVMNAGASGKDIFGLIYSVTLVDCQGRIKILPRKKIKFAYRRSGLEKFVVLSARLRLKKENKSGINRAIKECLSYRRDSQDYSFPNAGCVFKNPAGQSAGRLIDLCGLKGKVFGGAMVSLKHANFILNKGNARASDVIKLMRLIQKEVGKKFNFNLEPEIKIWQ